MTRLSLLVAFLCWLPASIAVAEEHPFAFEGKRIVFLGDSITHAGRFVALLEAQLESLGHRTELVNLGLPSETCSGLSESDHPFPRPSVQSRLKPALELSDPDVVVVCYGMNDGIYHPLSEQRFAAYRKGINRIISESKQIGVQVVLMTPPPFDPVPLRGTEQLVSADADDFSYKRVYENYDDVLKHYGQWILQQRDRVDGVIDLHAAVSGYLVDRRKEQPGFTMTTDGIHLNDEGHEVIASAIAQCWGLAGTKVSPEQLGTALRRQNLLHAAWLSHVGHGRPGMKPGLPLAEAQEQADNLGQRLPQ